MKNRFTLLFLIVSLSATLQANSFNNSMQEYINELKKEASIDNPNFSDFDAKRGEKIFISKHIGKKGKEISCVSCHSTNLQQDGKHFFTGKGIKALSPKANRDRLQSVKDVKKWLKRNFKDVYVRDGTALEKGDVLYYINSK